MLHRRFEFEEQSEALKVAEQGREREAAGWLGLAMFMLLFPLLFFLCVWFPIWLGVASPY